MFHFYVTIFSCCLAIELETLFFSEKSVAFDQKKILGRKIISKKSKTTKGSKLNIMVHELIFFPSFSTASSFLFPSLFQISKN